MPRAPHKSALLAAKPCAKRSVFGQQGVPNPVDAPQQRDIDPVDPRRQGRELALPASKTKASAGAEVAK